MIEAYKLVLKEGASVRRAEEIARRLKKDFGDNSGNSKKTIIISDEIARLQEKLQNAFGEKSLVKLTRSKRETKVLIRLKGTPKETELQLQKILSLAK